MPLSTVNVRCKDTAGIRNRRVYMVTGPTSYATGGEAMEAKTFGLGKLEAMNFAGVAVDATTGVCIVGYNYTTKKLMWFDLTGTEINGSTNLSTYTFLMEVAGT